MKTVQQFALEGHEYCFWNCGTTQIRSLQLNDHKANLHTQNRTNDEMGQLTNSAELVSPRPGTRTRAKVGTTRTSFAVRRRVRALALLLLPLALLITLSHVVARNQIQSQVQASNTNATASQRVQTKQQQAQQRQHSEAHDQHHLGQRSPLSGSGASARSQRQAHTPASLSSSLLRTFIRTNSMRAYHLDLHAYRPEAKYAGDPAFVDSRNPGHVQRCRRHLNHYNDLLRAYMQSDPMELTNTMDSLRLADTYGRPDSGLLQGHQFWLGSYERCLEISLQVDQDQADDNNIDAEAHGETREQVNSQYCLGLAQFPSWKQEDTKTSIKIGMCMPETCTSSMLNEQEDLFGLAEQMMKYQLGGANQPLSRLKLRSVYCLPHETSQARQLSLSAKLLVSVLSTLAIACLYATLHDYLSRKTETAATPAAARLLAARERSKETQSKTTSESTDSHEACAISTSSSDGEDSGCSGSSSGSTGEPVGQEEQQLGEQDKGAESDKKVAEVELARNWRTILVESFSLIRNFEKIINIEPKTKTSIPLVQSSSSANSADFYQFDRDVFFNSITGIKCIGLIWIIAAHTFLVGPITHKNLIDMDKLTKTWLANVYLAAHLMVDSFFALSGLLASYLLFRSQGLGKMRLNNWIVLTLHRYWRLTPLYLLCCWFAKSLGHLVNSGPLWDYSTAAQSPRLHCANESWWEAILHMSDFKSPKEHCVPFAWFIANGIKFSIITPLFLTVIYKSARRGYALIGAAILANIVLVVSLAINSNVDMKSVIEFKPESADNMLNNMEEVYTRPYSRIGAYLVGLLAGHIIYLIEAQQQPIQMSEKIKILIWSLVSATAIVLTFVVKIAGGVELEESAIPWIFSLSSGLIRPLWALCTCWLVFALAHGQARWLAKFLSADVWRLLIKLSFSAYLVQGEVIANLYLSYTHSSLYTYTEMVTRPIVATVITLALSLVMALVVEYPLIGIEELILPRRKRPSGLLEKKALDTNAGDRETLQEEAAKRQSADSVVGKVNITSTTRKACDFIVQSVNGSCRGEKLKEL